MCCDEWTVVNKHILFGVVFETHTLCVCCVRFMKLWCPVQTHHLIKVNILLIKYGIILKIYDFIDITLVKNNICSSAKHKMNNENTIWIIILQVFIYI